MNDYVCTTILERSCCTTASQAIVRRTSAASRTLNRDPAGSLQFLLQLLPRCVRTPVTLLPVVLKHRHPEENLLVLVRVCRATGSVLSLFVS